MTNVEKKYSDKADAALYWLEEAELTDYQSASLDEYTHGAIFCTRDPVQIICFLERCAEKESKLHHEDELMESVVLTIDFEFETMAKNRMDMSFTFWRPGEDGSISFSLGCIKERNGAYCIYGDADFLDIAAESSGCLN